MRKILLILICLFVISNALFSQNKWVLKDSVIKFPANFGSWIQRNVGKYNPLSEPIGTKVQSFQLKEVVDFNKDGYEDLCMELYLRIFDTNNPSNSTKYQDSLMNYYKGIFINQKNGTYLLDTNYIIHGRGAIWYGDFGDFNGDGLMDYYNNCYYYEYDQANKDKLFYKYENNNASPSHVYFNNGKGFDRVDLDTVDMISGNSDVVDINKDGRDEIIAIPGAKFIVYQYNPLTKQFDKKFGNLNDSINKKYGGNIKFLNFKEIIDNKINLTLSYNYNGKKEDWMLDILQINLNDSSFKVMSSFKHPSFFLNDGSIAMAGIADKKDVFKYEDLNGDNSKELIFLGPFSFKTPLNIFQSNERMGINIIENNIVNTTKYWNYDTTEIGFRLGGYIEDLNADKISEIIAEEWIYDASKNYFGYYYALDSGKYIKKFIDVANKNIIIKSPINTKYKTWSNDFNKDGSSDIIIYDPESVMTSYMYTSINCKDIISKPTFNTNKFSFCTNDSLKLSINHVNKGDTLKWYYGSKSDLSNVSNKTFLDSTKLFVTRTDSLGCMASSDTVQITKNSPPVAPVLSRDTSNYLVSTTFNTIWYKDGTLITDTAQKIKPTIAGSYTAKTTQNGCASMMSAAYYYLVTDIINLENGEYIKLAPNPFQGTLNFDFNIKGYQYLNLEVIELSTGNKVDQRRGVYPGSSLQFNGLNAGTYLIRVISSDNKVNYQFKMVKL